MFTALFPMRKCIELSPRTLWKGGDGSLVKKNIKRKAVGKLADRFLKALCVDKERINENPDGNLLVTFNSELRWLKSNKKPLAQKSFIAII